MHSRQIRSGGLLAVGLLALSSPCLAASITTTQSGVSRIVKDGVETRNVTDGKTDGRVSVFAIDGTLTTPEARTAARSSAAELAANARIDDKHTFFGPTWTEVISAATYSIEAASSGLVNHAAFDFFLPPSYLEVTSNSEFAQNELEVVILASLEVCFELFCGSTDRRLFLQDILTASYEAFSHGPIVEGDPTLDLAPLLNPTVTDTGAGSGSYRTVNVSFPAFGGHLDLGLVPVGSPVTVEYQLQARAQGRGRDSIGIAAINDPFTLDTDPVGAFAPLRLTLTDVPEPGTAGLVVVGAALVARRRRPRPASSCSATASATLR